MLTGGSLKKAGAGRKTGIMVKAGGGPVGKSYSKLIFAIE